MTLLTRCCACGRESGERVLCRCGGENLVPLWVIRTESYLEVGRVLAANRRDALRQWAKNDACEPGTYYWARRARKAKAIK